MQQYLHVFTELLKHRRKLLLKNFGFIEVFLIAACSTVAKVNVSKTEKEKRDTSHTNQPATGLSIHSRMNSSSKQNHENKNTKCLKEG